MRVLLILALAVIIIYLVRGQSRRQQGGSSAERPSTPHSSGPASRSEPMRQCAHCGAYFPASEAVGDSPDKLFCSDEHRRQHLDKA